MQETIETLLCVARHRKRTIPHREGKQREHNEAVLARLESQWKEKTNIHLKFVFRKTRSRPSQI